MHSSPRLARFAIGLWPLVALALVLSTHQASAEQAPRAAEQAKLRFEAGKAAYRAGRYSEAVTCFLDADALAPRAPLSFDIARAYEQLGDAPAAVRFYRNYLERAPTAANAPAVRARIAALEMPAGAATPLAAGVPFVATEPAPPPPRPHEPSAAPATFAPWSWVALGAGGAALVGAGGAELVRRDAESDARGAPDQIAYSDEYDRMRGSQTAARVLLVTGGVLAVTGSALLAVDLGRGRRAETRLACGPGACVGTFGGSF
jgi:tetratricopeptide (TPR) repeat protein